MTIIPCVQNIELRRRIEEFAGALKTSAHTLGRHELSEEEFYRSGVFRGAIEVLRGEFSATMREKREFVRHVFNFMQDRGYIANWVSASEANRHDYVVELNSGRTAAIEAKGCLDGNNTTIYERPPNAHEFIIWSICTNPGADPRRNAWSGIHTRLSAEIVFGGQRVDGLIIWDMVCGTFGRPCPKVKPGNNRYTEFGPYKVPPPCIYVLPSTVPSPRNNPHPPPQQLREVELLQASNDCFWGDPSEINYVDFQVHNRGADIMRTTTVRRGGEIQRASKATAIRRA